MCVFVCVLFKLWIDVHQLRTSVCVCVVRINSCGHVAVLVQKLGLLFVSKLMNGVQRAQELSLCCSKSSSCCGCVELHNHAVTSKTIAALCFQTSDFADASLGYVQEFQDSIGQA